jgi:hypothetical protein
MFTLNSKIKLIFLEKPLSFLKFYKYFKRVLKFYLKIAEKEIHCKSSYLPQ